jgi:hypothetical protein
MLEGGPGLGLAKIQGFGWLGMQIARMGIETE